MKSGLRIAVFVVVSSVFSLPLRAEVPGFPADGLADRVGFWEKVFTVYGADDLIVHDRERVDLIYDVVTERNRDRGVRQVRQLLDEIRAKIATPEALSAAAREIYDRIEADGVRMTAGDIAVLRSRIHVQRGIKERFRDGVIRSGRYLTYFEQVFEEEGVPLILTLLPLVESSYENNAYSSAGAAGIWQFTRSTGRQFMRITSGRDDRLNPAIAARSAARLLRGNFDRLKVWPLAVTAYNHGRAGMQRAQRAHGSDMATVIKNYTSRTFGYASKNFYAEFIAAINVYEEYELYFGPIALDAPLDFSTAATRIARAAPSGPGTRYRVRSGDSLSLIAARNGTSVDTIMDLNNLANDRIFVGETLMVSGTVAREVGADGQYRIQPGDTLSEIASQFGLGVSQLMAMNGLGSDRIVVGDTLAVSSGEATASTAREYLVRWGDTLSDIATQFGVGVRDLMDLNDLRNSRIYVGQILLVQ